MLLKFGKKSAQKSLIFSSKANFEKSLLFLFCAFLLVGCSSEEEHEVKSYKIARDPSWYPLYLMGNGPLVLGFTDDLLTAVAHEEHFNVELMLASWDNLRDGLDQEHYDAICTALPRILNFADTYAFSEPYLVLGPVLVVPADSDASSLQDLEGKEVGILSGSSNIIYLESYPDIVIRTYFSVPLLLEDLANGNIDGGLVSSLPANGFIRDLYQNVLKIVGDPLGNEALRVLTLKVREEEFITKFNKGLQTLKKNGQYDNLLKKWKLK